MTLNEIINQLNLGNLSIIIFLILSLVEISPIKINPWSMLCKWLQKQLSLEEIKEDLMDSRRTRIIRFDDELIEKRPHRKDMFDAILIDCDKYEKFCKAHHGYVNSVADDSINHIKEVYAELKREDAFLTYKKRRKEMIELKNSDYDKLKWIAQIFLPALATLYFALSQIWGFGYGEEVVGSITAIDAFLGVCLGISTSQYKKGVTTNVDS